MKYVKLTNYWMDGAGVQQPIMVNLSNVAHFTPYVKCNKDCEFVVAGTEIEYSHGGPNHVVTETFDEIASLVLR